MTIGADELALDAAVPRSALAIYAHPDDPEVGCGGTIAAWTRAGCVVHVVVCCRGEKGSSDPGADTDAVARRRAQEVVDAASVLGVAGHEFLGFDDGALAAATDLRMRLVALIRAFRPEAVLGPDPTAVFFGESYYNHPDHRALGWALLDAVSPSASNPHYEPGTGAAHAVTSVYLSGTLEPTCAIDISASIDTKIDAVLRHTSQVEQPGEWFREAMRERAADAGRRSGVRFAESFRRLRL